MRLLATLLVVACSARAAPTFVQKATSVGQPRSLTMDLTAGNTIVVIIWGPTSFFPVTVSDNVGSSFVFSGMQLNGSGALGTVSARTAYARVATSGPRTITVGGMGSTNDLSIHGLEFAGVTPNYYWSAYFTATGGPADGRSVPTAIDGLVVAHVVASDSIQDGGTSFTPLVSTPTEFVGWLAAWADGDYPLTKPVTGAWMTYLISLSSRSVSPGGDAGLPPDAGRFDAGTFDAGAVDAGPGDSGTPDGGIAGDAGAGLPDAGTADAGAADGGGTLSGDGGADGGGATDGGPRGPLELQVGCACATLDPSILLLAWVWLLRRCLRRESNPRQGA